MDDEVSEAGVDGRSAIACAGSGAADLWRARYQDHEGACVERSCASACVDTAASDDKSNDAVVEGKDGAQDDDGVSALKEALLGAAHVGARVLLL